MKQMNIRDAEITKEMYNAAKKIEKMYHLKDKFEVKSEEFKKYNKEWIKADEEFQKNFSDEFDTLEIVNEYERREWVKKMKYYDEVAKILKNDEEVKNFLASEKKIGKELLDFSKELEARIDVVGSCNSEEEARKNCFQNAEEVSIALSWGYSEEQEIFETFVELVNEGYIDINTLELTLEVWLEYDFNRQYILSAFEKIKGLSFQALETITKRNQVFAVLIDIINGEI